MELTHKNKFMILLGILPALSIYLVFCIIPIIFSVFFSLTDWDGLTQFNFIGLANFARLLRDKIFWNAFKNNIIVVLASIFGQVPLGLMLALILNKKIKGTKFFRTVIFMPVVLSTVIVSLVWNMVYNYQVGLLNRFLDFIGLGMFAQNWLGDPKLAMLSVSITIIWQYIGLYTVVFLAALQNVPEEIMEAAEIDGATGWKKTFYVTIPMIWDSIIVALIYCISGSLRSFDLIFLMTNGGPAHATEVMAIYMYNKAFSSFRYGYASAISIMILVMSLVLIFFVNKIMRRENA